MGIYLLNYADWRFDREYKKMQQRQSESARGVGIKHIINWNREKLIRTVFYKKHKKILDQRKGVGFWLWNLFLIYKYLNRLSSNDVLIYCDCDFWFNKPITKLVNVCERNNGMFHIKSAWKNSEFTKKYCFKKMKCDSPAYYSSNQTIGGFVILKKNEFTKAFYKTCLALCCDMTLINDRCYGVPNQKGFREHRHTQSVLSLLHKKHNLNSFRWPCIVKNKNKKKAMGIRYNEFERQQNRTFRGLQILRYV